METPAKIDLPRYQSHKVVQAAKLSAVQVLPDGGMRLTPEDPSIPPFDVQETDGDNFLLRLSKAADGDPGYFVFYNDGYRSWSPTRAFEDGYTLEGHEGPVTKKPGAQSGAVLGSPPRHVVKLARALYESDCEAQGLVAKWADVSIDNAHMAYWCNFATRLLRRYNVANVG